MSKTIGISVNEREQRKLVKQFDDALDCGPDGSRSRSDQIKIAMRLWRSVGPVLEEAGYDIDEPLGIQGIARDAVYQKVKADGGSLDG